MIDLLILDQAPEAEMKKSERSTASLHQCLDYLKMLKSQNNIKLQKHFDVK